MTEPKTDDAPIGLQRHMVEQVSDVAHPSTVGSLDATVEAGLELKARSQWSYARSRFLRHRLAMVGLVVLIIIFGTGIFAGFIAPYSYEEIDLTNVLQGPTTTAHHFFGTDEIGRDYFSRVIFGVRTSLEVGVFVAFASTIIGVVIGAISGYYSGWIDNILMRITDLVLTLPVLAVLLTAAALLGQGSQWRVSIILALFYWTTLARIVRGVFLSLREKEYVEAAKAAGSGDLRIMFRHILPNTLGPIVVSMTLVVGAAIILEAVLSFLGFGIKPPTPSLGSLIASGQQFPQKWWITVFPGLVLLVIVMAINFVGDGLRDALDPQQRRVRA